MCISNNGREIKRHCQNNSPAISYQFLLSDCKSTLLKIQSNIQHVITILTTQSNGSSFWGGLHWSTNSFRLFYFQVGNTEPLDARNTSPRNFATNNNNIILQCNNLSDCLSLFLGVLMNIYLFNILNIKTSRVASPQKKSICISF